MSKEKLEVKVGESGVATTNRPMKLGDGETELEEAITRLKKEGGEENVKKVVGAWARSKTPEQKAEMTAEIWLCAESRGRNNEQGKIHDRGSQTGCGQSGQLSEGGVGPAKSGKDTGGRE